MTGPDTLQIAQRKCTIDLEELDHRFSTFPVDLFRTLSVVDRDAWRVSLKQDALNAPMAANSI